ncbi:50S ribosomal protein L5 [Enterobacteriaceae endosymbiont of Macroplea appendiculata]|uniref:50S ribosomal protein L5 n=1 Tax=Enterobacteriaceae endosymbiont of Macroplea appendiculata TaxID=2675790 RepID=UPI001449B055|nr:50S ribosomal protein L5 [Enterobacteriaceae endosymbiont of Macroplea appendiculata]QJC30874.1 50S ribosomal protein L5 [Enterobacteriaceae endosymbiont of Macroplea appendiculata]
MSQIYHKYKKKIIPKLMSYFKYHSIMQVPCIKKIVLNIGIGKVISNKKLLDNAIQNLTIISGQKAIKTQSRKSIAGFKIRKGDYIGCKVTLRKINMWYFFERLLWIAIPRIRDFRGFSPRSFDGFGNYNIGIKEHIIFPEINFDKIDHICGLNITINTSCQTNKEGYELLSAFNFPFKDMKNYG